MIIAMDPGGDGIKGAVMLYETLKQAALYHHARVVYYRQTGMGRPLLISTGEAEQAIAAGKR